MKKDVVSEPAAELSDAALIERCLSSDALAWEMLIRRYQNLIYSIPIQYRFSLPDAADIFQSVCVILMEKLKTLRNAETIASWLYVTTRRQCWKTMKKKSREVELEEGMDKGADSNADELVLQHQIRRGMEHLSDKCRDLITSLYYADPPLSYEEITARFGIPFGSIGPTRARCLERLRNILTKKE